LGLCGDISWASLKNCQKNDAANQVISDKGIVLTSPVATIPSI